MTENYYIAPNEQRLLEVVEGLDVVLVEDVMQALKEMHPQSVRNALSSLARKGRLFRVKNGVYLRCDPPGSPVIGDPAKLALTVFKGYVAFSSALHHWKLIEYEPFTLFVATRGKSGTRVIGEYTFRAVSIGDKARGFVYDGGVYVSSLEKTIFDCIYKPVHAGGYPLVARAIGEARPDWREVARWFDLLGSQSLRQRGGYVLKKTGNAPRWLLEDMASKATEYVWLDPMGKRKGNRSGQFRVIDNVGGWDGNR
jgi:predicted transcriptional regulator of viral defense system